MLHMQPTRRLAAVAAETAISGPALHALQLQLAVDAAGALLGLVAVVALALYKPRGLTRYGARKLGADPLLARTPWWVKVFLIGAVVSLIAVHSLSGVGAHHGHRALAQCWWPPLGATSGAAGAPAAAVTLI